MRSLNIIKKGLTGLFAAAVVFTGAAVVMAQDSPRDEYDEWQSARRELANELREYRRNPSRSNYRGWQDARRDERREYREYREYQTALASYGGRWNPSYNDGNYNNGRTVVVSNNPYGTGMYRIYTNGRYYNVNNRGYNLLRQAVNRGYQRGYRAGVRDRRNRGFNYYNNSEYRSGSYGYSSYVTRNQYQYYFQQGFQRGYEDGFYARARYGTRVGSSYNILGSVVNTIMNVVDAFDNDNDY